MHFLDMIHLLPLCMLQIKSCNSRFIFISLKLAVLIFGLYEWVLFQDSFEGLEH